MRPSLHFVVAALGLGLACSAKAPVPPPPPAVHVIVIPATQVGQKLLTAFDPAPERFAVQGELPPGVTVQRQSGQLWLVGTPTKEGTYRFEIVAY